MTDEHDHITKSQYDGIVQKMHRDQERSDREREVERAHGQDLPSLLGALHRKHEGNVSAMLRDMNKRLPDSSVSRPTLYDWVDRYEVEK